MLAKIASVYWKSNAGDLQVKVFGRFEDGSRLAITVNDTRPHFFVQTSQIPDTEEDEDWTVVYKKHTIDTRDHIEEIVHNTGLVDLFKRPLAIVYTYIPSDVPIVRLVFKTTYEADVVYRDRVAIQTGKFIDVPKGTKYISINDLKSRQEPKPIPFRVLKADIETRDSVDSEKTPAPVLSIAAHDSFTDIVYVITHLPVNKREVIKTLASRWKDNVEGKMPYKLSLIQCGDESETLRAFKLLVSDIRPDVITGWYYTEFDEPYLANRYQMITGGELSMRPYAMFDMKQGFDDMYRARKGEGSLQEANLEFVTTKILGHGKIERDEMSMAYMAVHDPDKLIAYNIWDVILTDLLDKSEGIIEFYESLSVYSNTFLDDTLHSSRLIDNYILNYVYERDINMRFISKEHIKFPDGFVKIVP